MIPRAALDVAEAMKLVEPILARVKNGNESDLIALAKEFDGIAPQSIRVPRTELTKALAELDPKIRAALELSAERIRKVHNDQQRGQTMTRVVDGGSVTEKWIPVDRVGLYVPGGRAVYPSSVMMNVIPAQIAKVQSIAIASPPQSDFGGLPHPTILATCELLGITEVYAVGGAQAIALFAYGMENLCEKCDLVTGPGNAHYVESSELIQKLVRLKLPSLQMRVPLQPMLQRI
jgi:histidinol dehydrogenase